MVKRDRERNGLIIMENPQEKLDLMRLVSMLLKKNLPLQNPPLEIVNLVAQMRFLIH